MIADAIQQFKTISDGMKKKIKINESRPPYDPSVRINEDDHIIPQTKEQEVDLLQAALEASKLTKNLEDQQSGQTNIKVAPSPAVSAGPPPSAPSSTPQPKLPAAPPPSAPSSTPQPKIPAAPPPSAPSSTPQPKLPAAPPPSAPSSTPPAPSSTPPATPPTAQSSAQSSTPPAAPLLSSPPPAAPLLSPPPPRATTTALVVKPSIPIQQPLIQPVKKIFDPELNTLILNCKDNLYNKNNFINIFMNQFLNRTPIQKITERNRNDEDPTPYFTELFKYSKNVIDNNTKYEEYTKEFNKYIKQPVILSILDGIPNNTTIPHDNLIKIDLIPQLDILKTQPEYNKNIGILSQPSTQQFSSIDPFKNSIYNYIDTLSSKDAAYLKLKKFDIVNNIVNIDKGIHIYGEGGASTGVPGILSTVISTVAAGKTVPNPVANPVPSSTKATSSTVVGRSQTNLVKTGFPLIIPIEGPFDLPRWDYPTHPNDVKPKPQSYNIQFIEKSLKYIPEFIKKYQNTNLQGELFGNNFENKIKIFIVSGPYKNLDKFNKLYELIKKSSKLISLKSFDPNLFNFLHIGSWFFHNDSTIKPLQNEIDLIRTKMNGPPTISYYICLIIIKKEQNILIYPYIFYNNKMGELVSEQSQILYKSTDLDDDIYKSENLSQFIEI